MTAYIKGDTMTHMIELKKVSKFYSNKETVSTGFSRIDLELDMGEFVVITGESGSGKSTLLNVISGLDSYEEGEMFVGGEDTSGYKSEDYENYRKTYIGNIFQDFNLVNSYTVYQNIELSMLLCGRKKSECKERIEELIELVGLTDYTKAKASKLSGGQKQRVAIARALAKDAPIIVADEPTGNLDSESAKKVMETLYRISKDKLVIIVTHNFEQAEQYMTRKLTMHDGKIIEDKKIQDRRVAAEAPSENASPEETDSPRLGTRVQREMAREGHKKDSGHAAGSKPLYGSITAGTQLRLGLRNTFNLPTKFILLLVVYLFVSTAVIGQYGSTKNSLHQTDLLGYNQYFTGAQSDRVVLQKNDKTAFTQADYDKINKISNVKKVVKNDLGLDSSVQLDTDKMDIGGPVYPESDLRESDLKYGELPKADNEIVIAVSSMAMSYDTVKDMGKSIIGTEYYLTSGDEKIIPEKAKIVGVVLKDDDSESLNSGGVKIYVTDAFSRQIFVKSIAQSSKTTVDYNGTKVETKTGQVIYPSAYVPVGQAYISEDQTQYFTDSAYSNKPITLTAENIYFTDSVGFKVGKKFTSSNIASLLHYTKDDYDMYSNAVFINSAQFSKLYDKGDYQVSAILGNETKSADTLAALRNAGYKPFALKNALSDVTGGFSFVIKLLSIASLIIEFIVLFFIAYAVIRLIMKSRNSYYSVLRILGADKKCTDNILKAELLVMMVISYIIDLVLVYLVKSNVIAVKTISVALDFMTVPDYILLFVALAGMSLLIARRYSRKIFSKTAMNVYREEA